jgi:hypothetical protein
MLSILFFVLAAICNACMDTLVHHFEISVFCRPIMKQSLWNFFCPAVSWKNKYIDRDPKKGLIKWFWGLIDKPVFLTDAWHLFKSLMIVFICLSIAAPFFGEFHIKWKFAMWTYPAAIFFLYGLVWNLVFNLFYNHFLIKK